MKGNESFYRQIDWLSSGRRCRERKVPERFSGYPLDSAPDTVSEVPKVKRRPGRPRKSRPPSPSSGTATQQQTGDSVVQTPQSSPNAEASKKIVPPTKTSPLSKIRQLLKDERVNLQKLVEEEKRRAFDDEVDLNVQEGQTVKLVAWIRFHRIYQSGRMQIRYLSRRASHVILVMRPDEIVSADISRDIQTMKKDENAPEIVKKLLEPFISPEESSRYAVLLCDGLKWELVSCLTLKAPETPTTAEPQQPVEPEFPEPPKVIEEESIPRPEVDTEEIFKVIQLKRKEVEEKLGKIKQYVNHLASGAISKHPATTELVSEELSSFSPSGPAGISSQSEANPTDVIPEDQSHLLCDLPPSECHEQTKEESNLPELVSPSLNRSAERLDKMFSRLIQNSGDPGLGLFSNFGVSSALGTKPPELERLEPIGSTSGAVRRIRILPPPEKRVRRPPVFTKTFEKPAEEVASFGPSPVSLPAQFTDQQMAPPVTQSEFVPDCQLQFPEAPSQQMEETEPATPSEKFIFPNVVTAEINSVKSKKILSLKIVLEEMPGRNRVDVLLPLHKIDDRWGLVAIDHIPKCGFQIPGLSVFIPGDVLGRAASTAIERKTRVSIPFRCQLKNSESIFKSGCGIYGNPKLPRHVFVGPFPAKHFENCPPQSCVMPISLTKPVPSDSPSLETFGVKSTEPAVSSAETLHPEVLAEKKDEQSDGNFLYFRRFFVQFLSILYYSESSDEKVVECGETRGKEKTASVLKRPMSDSSQNSIQRKLSMRNVSNEVMK